MIFYQYVLHRYRHVQGRFRMFNATSALRISQRATGKILSMETPTVWALPNATGVTDAHVCDHVTDFLTVWFDCTVDMRTDIFNICLLCSRFLLHYRKYLMDWYICQGFSCDEEISVFNTCLHKRENIHLCTIEQHNGCSWRSSSNQIHK